MLLLSVLIFSTPLADIFFRFSLMPPLFRFLLRYFAALHADATMLITPHTVYFLHFLFFAMLSIRNGRMGRTHAVSAIRDDAADDA